MSEIPEAAWAGIGAIVVTLITKSYEWFTKKKIDLGVELRDDLYAEVKELRAENRLLRDEVTVLREREGQLLARLHQVEQRVADLEAGK